jgi:stearoyl-CoA desaturase (delta-9 desaturase)
MMTFNNKFRILYILLMISVPASIIVAFETSWWYLICSLVWFRFTNTIFTQIGLHRYFTHRNFKTGPWRHRLLAVGTVLNGSGSIITWGSNHIHHHRYSDKPMDVHSPNDGWWHVAFSWAISSKEYFTEEKKIIVPRYLLKDKLIVWLHNNYFMIWFVGIVALMLIDWKFALFGLIAPAGWNLLSGNILANLLTHIKLPGSYKNFNICDNSYNNKSIQIFAFGEGLHNNHHHDPSKHNQAVKPGEYDPASWIIKHCFEIKSSAEQQ